MAAGRYPGVMDKPRTPPPRLPPDAVPVGENTPPAAVPEEIGGPQGLEPTRYGDWERNGRVSDF